MSIEFKEWIDKLPDNCFSSPQEVVKTVDYYIRNMVLFPINLKDGDIYKTDKMRKRVADFLGVDVNSKEFLHLTLLDLGSKDLSVKKSEFIKRLSTISVNIPKKTDIMSITRDFL